MAVNKGKFGELNYFYGKKHTKENLEKNRLAHIGKSSWIKNKICINNTHNNKYISIEELNYYIELGWKKGGKSKKKVKYEK